MALHFLLDDDASLRIGDVELTGTEAHHAATVRRVRVGEAVTVGDGRGGWGSGHVREVENRRVVLEVADLQTVPASSPRIVLVQALAKGDRDELAIQTATELGVDEVVPWRAARSVSRWDEAKTRKGVQRWRTIVREASKQAHRAWVPEVAEPVDLGELAARAAASTLVVLEPSAPERLAAWTPPAGDVTVIVGPEGGIAPEERERLEGAGAQSLRIGREVLRTSTAGPAVISVLNLRLGRW